MPVRMVVTMLLVQGCAWIAPYDGFTIRDGGPDAGIDGCALGTVYRDDDHDSYGVAAMTLQACGVPDGWASRMGDCNDTQRDVNPGATEVCDAIDNDCDGNADEGLPQMNCWPDADGDGYGDSSATPQMHCGCPTGLVSMSGDCFDGDARAHPGADYVAGTYCLSGTCSIASGSGDWNCDGTTELEWTSLAYNACVGSPCYSCRLNPDDSCYRPGGWEASAPPPCAVSVQWMDCDGVPCTSNVTSRIQGCR